MTYRPSGRTFRYAFSAHGLSPGQNYSLIYYPDPWPGTGLVCLSAALTPDTAGEIAHHQECVETDGSLPKSFDDNYPGGAKIWLVPDADVDCGAGTMVAWNPDLILYETEQITYTDTSAAP